MSGTFLKFILSLFLISITGTVFANGGTALFFCSNFSENEAVQWAENKSLEFISFLEYENTLLVKNQIKNNASLNDVCFISELRQLENHLAFSKNELILRVNSGMEREFEQFLETKEIKEFELHDFIPHQYLLKNVVKTEDELRKLKAEIQEENWLKVIQINTVHTLSVNSVDDPLFMRQWALKNTGSAVQNNGTPGADMKVDSAWNISTGDSNIKIVILDSGVDTLQEDLIDNILPGHDAFASDTQDTKGFPTPNFSNDGHGTACAGIAAASGNNALGIAGVAYSSKIVPVRIFYYQDYGAGIGIQPSTNSNALISGSAYAWRVANGDIMSTSAGLPPIFISFLNIDTEVMNQEIADAFDQGRNGKGIAMFFSSGNEDENKVLWPAVLDNTIAVGASSMCDERKNPNDCSPESWGSSYGQKLDIVAPGVRISTTDMTGSEGYSNNDYTFTFNGTSAACPNAAGVGALILSVNPDLHARDVRAIIRITAHKDSLYQFDSTYQHGTWNEEVGYGRVDAFEALKLAQTYSSSISVDEIMGTVNEKILNIYPNPNNGNFYIENKSSEVNQVKVFNLEGKEVRSIQMNANEKRSLNLEKGLYFVGVHRAASFESVKKVVVY